MKFFGWRMVFTGLAVEFTVIGFLFYSFPIFWPYLISELGMTESQLGMVTAFYFIPVAILAIFVGRALDKYSVKNFMMIGSMIYAVGLFSLSFINSFWSLITIYLTILALGSIMMGNLAVAKLISNWFDKNAGRALGIAAVGISFSGVVLPLIVDPLLDIVGWRNVYVIFASVVLFIILPLIFFVVIDDPYTVNQVKDGMKRDLEEESLPKVMTSKKSFIKKSFLDNFFSFRFPISFHDGCNCLFAYSCKQNGVRSNMESNRFSSQTIRFRICLSCFWGSSREINIWISYRYYESSISFNVSDVTSGNWNLWIYLF